MAVCKGTFARRRKVIHGHDKTDAVIGQTAFGEVFWGLPCGNLGSSTGARLGLSAPAGISGKPLLRSGYDIGI